MHEEITRKGYAINTHVFLSWQVYRHAQGLRHRNTGYVLLWAVVGWLINACCNFFLASRSPRKPRARLSALFRQIKTDPNQTETGAQKACACQRATSNAATAWSGLSPSPVHRAHGDTVNVRYRRTRWRDTRERKRQSSFAMHEQRKLLLHRHVSKDASNQPHAETSAIHVQYPHARRAT